MSVQNIIGQELQVLDKNLQETINDTLQSIEKPEVLNEIIKALQDLLKG
jgi:hypothetical protein